MENKISITLKHLLINKKKMIGLKFYPNKVIQALIKELPNVRWSSQYEMAFIQNNKSNLQLVYSKFKGVAWIDGNDFFKPKSNLPETDNKSVIITTSKTQYKIFIKLPAIEKSGWVDKIKTFSQAYFIKKHKLWVIRGGNDNYLYIKKYFTNEGCNINVKHQEKKIINTKCQKWYYNKPVDNRVMQEFRNTLTIKRASEITKNIYISMFKRFLAYFYGIDIKNITTKEIIDYMLWEIEKNNISGTVQNQLINAIKYYFEKTLDKARTVYSLPRAKKEKQVPTVLNKKELNQLFSKIGNIKHKCIISLLFSSGMRRNELINLKPEDIDFERKIVSINKGKGNKGRISILSDFSIKCLKKYMSEYKPQGWLFVGQTGGQYSTSSIWKIFDRLKKQYTINKKGSVHLLRHTFATSLLETGTDIRYIQSLLGHNSLKTTQIYTYVANNVLIKIKSPMDSLDI